MKPDYTRISANYMIGYLSALVWYISIRKDLPDELSAKYAKAYAEFKEWEKVNKDENV